jgi:hypothetical protein
MLGLALLGMQAALPQHVPHHLEDILPCTKEAADLAVLHGGRAYFFVQPVHYYLGRPKKHVSIHLLVLVVAHVIVVIIVVGCVVEDASLTCSCLLSLLSLMAAAIEAEDDEAAEALILFVSFVWLEVMCCG